jgi:hypothetical protein
MKRRIAAIGTVLLGALATWPGPSQHTVTVTLNYDFTVDNGCSASVTNGCVKQFNIYDVTGGGTAVEERA